MNSLELIKKELIQQKTILEEKGIAVNTVNQNPSPSEITTAISKISNDFTGTTATEEDVKLGKTFYSQTNEIKTGTFDMKVVDNLTNNICSFISGKGSFEIEIPEQVTTIRKYAFFIDTNKDDSSVFYKENFTIPWHVRTIGEGAFYHANLTGTLTIPETCENIATNGFSDIHVTDVIINGGIIATSTYCFSSSKQLLRAYINNVYDLPTYLFYKCTALEELHLPTRLYSFPPTLLQQCTSVKLVKFNATTPCVFLSNSFNYCATAIFLVPYEYYEEYINASNFLVKGNSVYGFADFEKDNILPQLTSGYTLVWYSNLDDLKASTNPITVCPESGTMYCVHTPINE